MNLINAQETTLDSTRTTRRSLFAGGGECGALLRSIAWEKTSLGPIEFWPQSLKTAISIILENNLPMYLSVGRERIQFYNDSCLSILGPKHPAAFGSTPEKTFLENWKFLEPNYVAVENGNPICFTDMKFRINRKGFYEDAYFTFSYNPLRDERGDIIGVFGTLVETTSRVVAEIEARAIQKDAELARQELQNLFMQAPLPMALLMGKNHLFSMANDFFVQLVGRDVFGKSVSDAFTTSEMSLFLPYLDRVFKSGESVYLKEADLLLPNNDGVVVEKFIDVGFHPYRDANGVVIGILAILHNVTDQVLARKQVEESEGRYRSLTDSIPQMMWTSTPDGKVNYANERCLQYSGLSSQEKYGEGWITTIHQNDVPGVKEAWEKSMRTGEQFKEEYRIRRTDGGYRWFLGRAIPIKSTDGAVLYWIGTATDIDDQKKTAVELERAKEAAENANATKSAFLANMSHEIRTPLGAILGFSGLLKDANLLSQDRDQYIETINRNGQSLTRIIDDILDLAKVEAGRLDVEEIDFSLFDLMAEVVDLFKEKAKQKGIYLFLNIDDSVPSHISSDPTRLRQIMINIIGNAIKFTDLGGVRVHVKAQRNGEGMLRISVHVKDTGCGLTDEQKERLFKPFTQADNTTTRQFGGTGLGLALSKRLSEALGGTITIDEYVPEYGCTFTVSFLATEAKLNEPKKRGFFAKKIIDAPSTKINSLDGLNILLVDDSPDNQFLVKRILMKNGARVEIANDGKQAVDKALVGQHDLVLMDIQMPRMDGYQAIKLLADRGYHTPVIALTAHAMVEDRVKTESAGFVAHLTKPLDSAELLESVERHARPT